MKSFRYKTVLSEARVMGRNKVLFIYYSIKPPCYCSFHTPVAQFPIHTLVPKMTFSHLHRCSGLESSQSSPKMPLIPPDPDGSLSPVKPQSLPKSTVSAPLLQCCLLWIHMGMMTLRFPGIQRTPLILVVCIKHSPGETFSSALHFSTTTPNRSLAPIATEIQHKYVLQIVLSVSFCPKEDFASWRGCVTVLKQN